MKQVLFEELFSEPLRNGVSYPAAQRGRGIPMVNMREAFAYDFIQDQDCQRVPLTKEEQQRYILEDGDLLFVRQSLKHEGAGKCLLVRSSSQPRTWESHLIRARLSKRVADPRYYYYYFRSAQGRTLIESLIEQVAAAGIRGSDLRRIPVPYPKLDVQHRVSRVLEALDDKIAVNERIATTYEDLLSTKFAALACDREPETPSDAIRSDEVVEFNPKRAKPTGEAVPYVDMAAVPTSSGRVREWTRRAPKGGTRLSNGDTIMARITPSLENGKAAFVDFMADGEVGIGSTEFITMRPRLGVPPLFPYLLARSPRFRRHAVTNMVGSSGRQRCPVEVLANFPLQRPDTDAMNELGKLANKAFGHMRSLDAESATLAKLRDALLPKLISGELRLEDAEKAVEDVV